ncbi:MAG: hypothetical protein LHW59_11185 [Candidatus Cloacimonetes bacterium]|nr:hypothetical protein [Candidatus Cloacimonadota bacterium]
MNEIDLLNDDKYELPKNWCDSGMYFDTFLEQLYNDYINDISSMKPTTAIGVYAKKQIQHVQRIAEGTLESVKLYLSGQPSKAYTNLDNVLNDYSNLLNQLISCDVMRDSVGILYKLRRSSEPITSREGLFHVPFNLRHTISTCRYSIPGFPCLYLGGSLHVCYEELNRPEIKNSFISAFKINDSVRVLNFGYRPAEIALFISKMELFTQTTLMEFCETYMILWPLIAACSIRVRFDDKFKVEYIMPQLLLQWISNERSEIDGIRYFSTKVIYYPNNPKINCNFAFPVKIVSHRGYCAKMKADFMLTEPINWFVLKSKIFPHQTDLSDQELPPVFDGTSPYVDSEFAQFELVLNREPFEKL